MARSKRNLNDSRAESPDQDSDVSSPARSPVQEEPSRGRKGRSLQDEVNAQVASEMSSIFDAKSDRPN
jgi:hypothetical protein